MTQLVFEIFQANGKLALHDDQRELRRAEETWEVLALISQLPFAGICVSRGFKATFPFQLSSGFSLANKKPMLSNAAGKEQREGCNSSSEIKDPVYPAAPELCRLMKKQLYQVSGSCCSMYA